MTPEREKQDSGGSSPGGLFIILNGSTFPQRGVISATLTNLRDCVEVSGVDLSPHGGGEGLGGQAGEGGSRAVVDSDRGSRVGRVSPSL